LNALGQALNSETLKSCCFEVDGYTDTTGGSEYNQKLSEERAQSAINYLSSHDGIESARMMPKGYSKTHPMPATQPKVGRQKNRRVQVVDFGYGEMGTKD
jgi:OOP family OmpA-OmpF porin